MATPPLKLPEKIHDAADSLSLMPDELARVLGLHCDDVTDPVQLEMRLQYDQQARHKAERFIVLYNRLETSMQGNTEQMVQWLRNPQSELGTSPLIALTDYGRLEEIINLLYK